MAIQGHVFWAQWKGDKGLNDTICTLKQSEDPKLIIRVIIFELTQHISPRYINVTGGQTDRRTDGRNFGRTTYDSNTALSSTCTAR